MEKWLVVLLFFHPIIRFLKYVILKTLFEVFRGVLHRERGGGSKMFFSKIFHRCSSAIDKGVEKDWADMLLATPPLGIGAASLGRVFPVEAEGAAQCSSGSLSHLRRTSEDLD